MWCYSGKSISFRCECKKERSRDFSKKEAKKVAKEMQQSLSGAASVHFIWHDFMREFIHPKKDKFRWKGHELMERVREWAKEHPSVRIGTCDDDYHMSSSLVVIPHEEEHSYFGTSIIFIPQNGRTPSRIFLYRWGLQDLQRNLEYVMELEMKDRPPPPKKYVQTLGIKPKE